MKLNRIPLCSLALLALGLAINPAQAQLPISQTEGLLQVTLPAAQTTYLGLPFTRKPVGRFTVTSAAGSTLTLTGAALTPAALAAAATPHSVQLIGGANDGLVFKITGNTATTVTVAPALPTGIVASTIDALIIPDWTLATLFGASGTALEGDTTAVLADEVTIEDGGVSTKYFYQTPAVGWRKSDGSTTDQANARIPALRGLIIDRKAGVAIDFVTQGTVRSGTQRSTVPAASTTIHSFPFTTATTLAESGLQGAVTPGPAFASADKVQLEVGGVLSSYFFKPGIGWRDSGDTTNAGAVVIAAAKSVRIVRGGTVAVVYPSGFSLNRPKRFYQPVVATPETVWKSVETFVP